MAEEVPEAKRRRYSREADLEVVVEGEAVQVHSRDLMAASEVFAYMLDCDMRESHDGQIVLPGKSKDEFRMLLQHIRAPRAAAFPAITDEETAITLLRWADEYQIDGLTARCEAYLVQATNFGQRKEKVVQRLQQAVEFKLDKLRDKVASVMARNVVDYSDHLFQFAKNGPVMRVLWPALFKAMGMEPPEDAPTNGLDIQHVWPLVACGLNAVKHHKSMEQAVLNRIPRGNVLHGPTLMEVKNMHRDRFGGKEVEKVLLELEEAESIFKTRDGTYLRA